jgi:tetraacyldisaccharide 4'-kinase
MRRPWAAPLVPLYGFAAAAKNIAYDRGLVRPKRLRQPVISVGSLSAGGAGKTPAVMMLAELLQREGLTVDVLSRGYGRGSGVVEQVDPAGLAARFGDEPMEMARAGIKVFVGAERYAAGLEAERIATSPTMSQDRDVGHPTRVFRSVHLLDDGFQHRRLARDLDVVLLTAEDARDTLLPAGNLREPLRSLSRADVIVVRDSEVAELAPILAQFPQSQTWTIRRELILPAERPQRMIAFCGIARPEGFFSMVRAAGCELAGEITFPDHHAYGAEDYLQLVEAVQHAGADGLVMTAKDVVKIPEAAMTKLRSVAQVVVTQLRVVLADQAEAVARIRKVVDR